MASFVCNDGYTLTGSESSACQTNGTWDQQTPTCGIAFISSILFTFLHETVLIFTHHNLIPVCENIEI